MYQLTNKLQHTIALPAPIHGAVILKPNEVLDVTEEHFAEINKWDRSKRMFERDQVTAVYFDESETDTGIEHEYAAEFDT